MPRPELEVLEGRVRWRVEHGDALSLLRSEPADSHDALVTDPPAGIGFMGRDWDKNKGDRMRWIAWLTEIAGEGLRCLKPGAYGLVWALPRTSHWTGMALEDAGFEVRDCIHHAFGTGFPKSLNVGGGRGTALKPAHEHWWLVRKPLVGTVAENIAEHGTGALNVDACRVAHASAADHAAHDKQVQAIKARGGSMEGSWANTSDLSGANDVSDAGRWPPNLLLSHSDCRRVGTTEVKASPTWDTPNRDTAPSAFTGERVSKVRHGGSTSFAMQQGRCHADTEAVPVWECSEDCPVRLMDGQSGDLHAGGNTTGATALSLPCDSGGASRFFPQFSRSGLDDVEPFFYAAKPSRAERDLGLELFRARSGAEATDSKEGQTRLESPRSGSGRNGGARNIHPTVKSIELMRWLCRLVTPPGGLVADWFTGSGTTGCAALLEGLRFYGCEMNDTDTEPFVSIARARLTHITGGDFSPREALRSPEAPRQRALFGT